MERLLRQSCLVAFAQLCCLSAILHASVLERPLGKAPGHFGYYTVRKGAHTFWWKFPAQGLREYEARQYPLVLWIQGGPGASGTGFGNFEEIGPYSVGWKPRKHSWAERANLLFVDSPVGTGFSYVTSNSSYATNNSQIAEDLTEFLRQYVAEHNAADQPLYIFSESYGGKVCVDFAKHLLQAQKDGSIKVNLRGIALGDSWISPLDYVFTWGDYLKAFSLLDNHQLGELAPLLLDTQEAVADGNLTQATDLWGKVEERIGNLTEQVDWYNVLVHNRPDTQSSSNWLHSNSHLGQSQGMKSGLSRLEKYHKDPLKKFMVEDVTAKLGIIPEDVTWGSQGGEVFKYLAGDFMTDVIPSVDSLLDSGLPVSIYNGQLDLICSTLGLDAWTAKLQWEGLANFSSLRPQPIYAGKDRTQPSGFWRRHENLSLYIILKAGHMIPADQPVAALDLLDRILQPPSSKPWQGATTQSNLASSIL